MARPASSSITASLPPSSWRSLACKRLGESTSRFQSTGRSANSACSMERVISSGVTTSTRFPARTAAFASRRIYSVFPLPALPVT